MNTTPTTASAEGTGPPQGLSPHSEEGEATEGSEALRGLPYLSLNETLKGSRDNERYEKERIAAEGGSRSHGLNSRDRRGNGRFTAANEHDRFWSKVTETSSGCWAWSAATTSDGYGRFRVTRDGRAGHIRAHRWAYQNAYGPIPGELPLDHLCANRACVRPDHLEAVSTRTNAQRVHQRHRGRE